MDDRKCYAFKPSGSYKHEIGAPATASLHDSWTERRKLYEEAWRTCHTRIEKGLEASNGRAVNQIVTFVETSNSIRTRSLLPVALVLGGPNFTDLDAFFRRVGVELANTGVPHAYASVNSRSCSSVKSFLKTIIAQITALNDDPLDTEAIATAQKDTKLLNYDPQILSRWCQARNTRQVVIVFEDTEAFNSTLLGDIIDLFNLLLEKIPVVLIFGLATSVANFRGQMPKTALRVLEGQSFDVARADDVFENIFSAATMHDGTALRLGAGVAGLLADRQHDFVQSSQAYVNMIQYAYMCHYFANALSIFLAPKAQCTDFDGINFKAVRHLPSFQRHVEQLLKERQTNRAKGLLTSDKALYDAVVDGIAEGRAALTKITSAVHVLHQAKLSFTHLKQTSKSWIYIRAFGGALIDSPFLRELLLSIKKASPDVLTMLIESIAHLLPEEIASIVTTFGDRAKGLTREEDPMISTSRHDMKRQTSRTTMVAKKVELDSQPSTRSKKNRVISNILDKLHDTFKAYFETTLVDVSDLFLNEILIYDIKSPCRDALMPRPRHAIERALSSPFDYLNCACCTPTNANDNAAEIAISPQSPPTAILYRLYVESGALINVTDLYTAFDSVLEGNADEKATNM